MLYCVSAYSQKVLPKFIASTHVAGMPFASQTCGSYAKYQYIYYPTDFLGMPSGTVTAIYLRSPSTVVLPNTIVNNLRVGMASTELRSYPTITAANKYDTFVKMNSYVVNKAVFSLGPDTLHEGDWIKIPLSEGNFNFSKAQNFAFEIAFGNPVSSINTLFISVDGPFTPPLYRALKGGRDSLRTAYADGYTMELGIDITTTGIESESGITTLGLFPNPASGGRFNISFEARQSVKEATITVTDAAGREVYAKTYFCAGTSFFKVDLSGAAKGMYFVKVAAGEGVITRRLLIE